MDLRAIPPTATCMLSTRGGRSRKARRVEIWYVVIDGRLVLTGTPGARDWLANLRRNPDALLHQREPARDLAVTAVEVSDPAERRHIAEQAWLLQPWYGEQPYSIEDWMSASPMVVLTPTGQ